MFLQNTGVSFEKKLLALFQELLSLNHTLQKILKRERQLSSSCFAKVLFCGDLAPTLLQWLQMRPNLGHLSPPGYIIFISACLHYIYLRLVTLYLSPPGYIIFISAWFIYLSLPGYIIFISAWLHYIYLRLVFYLSPPGLFIHVRLITFRPDYLFNTCSH